MLPIAFSPAPQRVRRKRRRARTSAPPAGPLTLIACAYETSTYIELTFDRAIDVENISGSAFVVSDGDVGFQYEANAGVEVVSPTTVRLLLNGIDEWTGEGVHLTASADNGIVAVGDGAAWAGVTDLALPFP